MSEADFYSKRQRIYRKVEKHRNSKVIAYATGDRRNMETQIHQEVIDMFADHLDALFPADRISLILYTTGGDTLSAWSLVNLLRMFCDDLEIIVPAKARSAGTLMCLGANRVIMTKQATLGPIDPSLQGPLNPLIPGAPPDARAPVSVEAVKGYFEFAKSDVGVESGEALTKVLLDLAQKVHPLVLGQIFRTRTQIRSLAEQLLTHQVQERDKQSEIIKFLTSETGSHDYTINRREASRLGLKVEKPGQEFYQILKRFYLTIRDEFELATPFNPHTVVATANPATYKCVRCIIESVKGGAHMFVSEGTLTKNQVQIQPGVIQTSVQDQRTFEGWRIR